MSTEPPKQPEQSRRWWQFSLRALLTVNFLTAIYLAALVTFPFEARGFTWLFLFMAPLAVEVLLGIAALGLMVRVIHVHSYRRYPTRTWVLLGTTLCLLGFYQLPVLFARTENPLRHVLGNPVGFIVFQMLLLMILWSGCVGVVCYYAAWQRRRQERETVSDHAESS